MDNAEFTEDPAGSTKDPYSLARPELARVINTDLKLHVNFKEEVLEGQAILTIERKPLTNELILDNDKLNIKNVTNLFNGLPLHYDIGHQLLESFTAFEFIKIHLPRTGRICKIQIIYETSKNSHSLYWLKPEQTADKLHPFLLSYNKPMYARSMFPCQDTPSVKFTYTAEITVKRYFNVIMSARFTTFEQRSKTLNVYIFNQDIPVPPNAVIIAVGVLKQKRKNRRTTVFAENKFISKSIATFDSGTIYSMLQIAENLCGNYMWDIFNICVLPPSVAHFEIECPCVVFISPALLHGDHSCISYSLSRNIAQSWAGNLVTCANYNNLWLNKSFSIFISRKITSKMLISEEMTDFFTKERLSNLQSLIEKCSWQLSNVCLLKCLVPNITDVSPHNAIDYVPYEVGCTLLNDLENMLGTSKFELFLKSYFNKFAYKSINTNDWKSYLCQYFSEEEELLDRVNGRTWHEWFSVVPFEFVVPEEMTVWESKCYKLTKELVDWDETSNISSIIMQAKKFCDIKKGLLLKYLHQFHKYLTEEKLKLISDLSIFDHNNGNIRLNWLLLCIKVQWSEKVEEALNFAIEFCSPDIACHIFQHLIEWDDKFIYQRAIETYNYHKEKMLPETQRNLAIIVHLD